MPKRANEPIFWSLFGAGGVVAAFVLPVMIFVTGIAVPLGIMGPETLGYERMSAFAGHWLGKLILLVVVALPLWHGVHRIYHGLHDLGVQWGRDFSKWLCYGIAGLASLSTVIYLLRI